MIGTRLSSLLLLVAAVALAAALPPADERKQLAGPPSDFGSIAVPNPDRAASESESALFEVLLTPAGDTADASLEWTGTIDVDSTSHAVLTFLSPFVAGVDITLQPPGSQLGRQWMPPVEVADRVPGFSVVAGGEDGTEHGKGTTFVPLGGEQLPAVVYELASPTPGRWGVRVVAKQPQEGDEKRAVPAVHRSPRFPDGGAPHGFFVLYNESPLRVQTRLSDYKLDVGETIDLVVEVEEVDPSTGQRRDAVASGAVTVDRAEMDVLQPNGDIMRVNLKRTSSALAKAADGATPDKVDGVFDGAFGATQEGNYWTQAVIAGTDAAGNPFIRTSERLFHVDQRPYELGGKASAQLSRDEKMVYFLVDVKPTPAFEQTATPDLPAVRAFAQVWGTPAKGSSGAASAAVAAAEGDDTMVPVAWMSALQAPVDHSGRQVINMQLDSDWLTRAGVSAPFELRAVTLEDLVAYSVVSTVDTIDVVVDGSASADAVASPAHAQQLSNPLLMPRVAVPDLEITEQMRMGPRPQAKLDVWRKGTARQGKEHEQAEGGRIMLLHGYCAVNNPWPQDEFPEGIRFEDLRQSRSTDDFAQMVLGLGKEQGMSSVLAHSHGGLVALHLYAYYWSGLDNSVADRQLAGRSADEARIVQSMGSPYRGSKLAALAAIGDVVGVGCGDNADLAIDAAELWLSGIPPEVRAEVYYYRTQYDTPDLLNYCSLPANLVLDNPNDGVVSISRTVLDGGNDMGLTKGQCHNEGLKYPAQTNDSERNAILRASAAR